MTLAHTALNSFHNFLIRIFPPGEGVRLSRRSWAETLGLAGLFLLAAGVPLGKTAQLAGLFMMMAAFCASWEETGRFIKNDPVVRFILLFLLYAWGRTFWEILFPGPGGAETAVLIDYARKHTYIIFLPVVAWWMGASQKTVFRFYGIIACGLVLHILFFSNLSTDTMLGGRDAIGGSESLSTLLRKYAFICVLAIMWLVFFADRIVGLASNKRFSAVVARGVPWMLSLLLIVVMLLTLEARSSLILLVIFLFAAVVVLFLHRVLFPGGKKAKASYFLLLAIAIGAAVFLIYVNKDFVGDRFSRDTPVIQKFLAERDASALERSSFSLRLWLSIEGWRVFMENPVFGHASGNIRPLLENAERPQIRQKSHLHNTYMEMLASWGIIGFSLMALVFVYIVCYLFYWKKNNKMDFRVWLFLLFCTLLLLIGGVDQSLSVRQLGWVLMIIILAPAYGFGAHLSSRLKDTGG